MMFRGENTNVIVDKTFRHRFLNRHFFGNEQANECSNGGGRKKTGRGEESIFSHIAAEPVYFDMACRAVFA